MGLKDQLKKTCSMRSSDGKDGLKSINEYSDL